MKPVDRAAFLRAGLAGLAATGLASGCAPRPERISPQAAADVPSIAFFSRDEFDTLRAMAERVFPKDADSPGAGDLHVAEFIDGRLNGAYGWGARMYKQGPWSIPQTTGHGWQAAETPRDAYRDAIHAVNAYAQRTHGAPFTSLSAEQQDGVLKDCEAGKIGDFTVLTSDHFFKLFLSHVQQGLYSDPRYGGNAHADGWAFVGFPGDPMAYGDPYEKYIDQYDKEYAVTPRGLV